MSRQMVCPNCHNPVGKPIGRPRANIDNEKVLAAFRTSVSGERPRGNVAAAAKTLGLPRGTVWSRLVELGAIKKGI